MYAGAELTAPANVALPSAFKVKAVVELLTLNINAPVVSAVLTKAVPELVPAAIVLIIVPYKTIQRCPEVTVTACPEAIVTGPTDIALLPLGTV
jgi:hypothetical protein